MTSSRIRTLLAAHDAAARAMHRARSQALVDHARAERDAHRHSLMLAGWPAGRDGVSGARPELPCAESYLLARVEFEAIPGAGSGRAGGRPALKELSAVVRGECPRLLNEDGGGDAGLAIRIEAALTAAEAASPVLLEGVLGVVSSASVPAGLRPTDEPSAAGGPST